MNFSSSGEEALIGGVVGLGGPHGFGKTNNTTEPKVAKAN